MASTLWTRRSESRSPGSCTAELSKIEGVQAVFGADEFAAIGQPTPQQNPRGADLWLAAKSGYAFSGASSGDQLVTRRKTLSGTHGYLPDQPDMLATCIVSGPGIKPGTKLGKIRSIDIAPTIARILGIALPTAEGKPLDEIVPRLTTAGCRRGVSMLKVLSAALLLTATGLPATAVPDESGDAASVWRRIEPFFAPPSKFADDYGRYRSAADVLRWAAGPHGPAVAAAPPGDPSPMGFAAWDVAAGDRKSQGRVARQRAPREFRPAPRAFCMASQRYDRGLPAGAGRPGAAASRSGRVLRTRNGHRAGPAAARTSPTS